MCLFKKGSYAEAADVLQALENDKGFQTSALSGRLSDSEGKELVLAQSLYLSGKKEQALNIFTSRFPQSNESAKALLKSGKPVPAAKNKSAHAANDPYLEGLCAYAKEDWKTAADKLLSAARSVAAQDVKAAKSNNAAQADKKNAVQYGSETKSWALYYGANALYRSGKYAESYINASYGLGESVVSGRVTADNYIVNKSGDIIEINIGSKETQIVYGCRRRTGGCRGRTGPCGRGTRARPRRRARARSGPSGRRGDRGSRTRR